MPTNKKEYQQEYMKKYVSDSKTITCDICDGSFKSYSKYRHVKTKKHTQAIKDKSSNVNEINMANLTKKIDEIHKMLNKTKF